MAPLLDHKYRIMKVLGTGAFGKVYLACNELAKHNVAIKSYYNSDFSEDDIIREIQFLASLQHPFIVTFHHHFIEDSRLNIVMEYCKEGSLRDILSTKKLEIDYCVDICIKILDALSYIHSLGIIHRDIKPGNILLNKIGIPKLSDFGVSNTPGGTPHYLPPERFYSNASRDPKADLYSLGLVLLEMVTGKDPFWDIPHEGIQAAKINHSFVPVDLPLWLQEIILKATHPSPDLRFQSALEFSSALKAKCVPYVINKERIKADKLFNYAQISLDRNSWYKTKSYFEKGFEINSNSVLGNLTAGKYYLKTNKLSDAKLYFEKALTLNPGVDIKKELAEIHINEGNYPQAIYLLQNHLQLNPIDWEAYNLLAESYYHIDRFELAIEIIESVLEDIHLNCFWNNLFINHLMNRSLNKQMLEKIREKSESLEFISFNANVNGDSIKSWGETVSKKDKFLYQDYRFRKPGEENEIKIESSIKSFETKNRIFSIGRNKENNFVITDDNISRRHAVIVNHEKDVWIYDLASTHGVYVDDIKVQKKCFLMGKHKITLGRYSFYLYSSGDYLI